MIKMEHLIHRYTIWKSETEKSKKTVLDGISCDIPSGQFIGILGSNGSGKSTLAKHMNVLLLPDEGTIWIDGKNTADREKLWEIREEVGMVFQNPDNQIIGTSVEEDVAFGPENRNLPSEEIQRTVEASLNAVGMIHKRKTSPSYLSGGQKQRVAIAGALAGNPSCIVLDEPTAMLDPQSREEVLKVVQYLNKEKGITIIWITHHTEEVTEADQIFLMDQGKIVKSGSPQEIFAQPEFLKSIKLEVPAITELSDRLRQNGIPLSNPILREDQLIAEITNLKHGFAARQNERENHQDRQNGQEHQSDLQHADARSQETRKTILEVKDISFTYGKGTVNECKVLENISFLINENETIGIIGSSGAGKTTLIKHLNGLLKPQHGSILFEGENVNDKHYRISKLRRGVGLVFQYPEQQLFGRTVLADVCFGPLNLGSTKEEAEQSAKECLRLVGMDESYDYVSPFELSGGQKRCVAIAGVLAMKPKILVLDEPAAGLDPGSRLMIFDLLERIRKERNMAIVLVSHDMDEVARYTDRVLVVHGQKLALTGTPQEVFSQTKFLDEIGIGVPQVTSVTRRLMDEGIPVSHPAVTMEEAEQLLLENWKGADVYA